MTLKRRSFAMEQPKAYCSSLQTQANAEMRGCILRREKRRGRTANCTRGLAQTQEFGSRAIQLERDGRIWERDSLTAYIAQSSCTPGSARDKLRALVSTEPACPKPSSGAFSLLFRQAIADSAFSTMSASLSHVGFMAVQSAASQLPIGLKCLR